MKKIEKHLLTLGLCVVMLLQCFVPVNAQELYVAPQTISQELAAICEKYDVTYELISYDSSVKYTRQEVDQTLMDFEESLKSIVRVQEAVIEADTIQPRVMEVTKDYVHYFYLRNTITTGTQVEVKVNATTNAGSISFMRVNSITSRPYGTSNNLVSYKQTNTTYTFVNGARQCEVEVTAEVTTQMSILGSVTQYTYDHVMGLTLNAT